MSPTPARYGRPVACASAGRIFIALAAASLLIPVAEMDAAPRGRAPIQRKLPARRVRVRPAPRPRARPLAVPRPKAPAPLAATPSPPPSPSAVEVIVQMTNGARASNGLPPFRIDDRLARAAQLQADAMARAELLSHELPGAALPTPASRLAAVGYDSAWWGENIGFGYDAAAMCASWANSPTHRANLLGPALTEFGVAVSYSLRGVPYYCQVFGSSR